MNMESECHHAVADELLTDAAYKLTTFERVIDEGLGAM